MNRPMDGDLRDRFAALRREDAMGAPTFDAMRASAVQQRSAGPRLMLWAPALAIVAGAVMVAIGVLRTRPPREPLVSLAATRWRSPTDFLLRVPGTEYLETVPRFSFRFSTNADWRNP